MSSPRWDREVPTSRRGGMVEGKVSTCPLLSGMGRCLLVLVGMGNGKVLLVLSYLGWGGSYLSPTRWDCGREGVYLSSLGWYEEVSIVLS